MVQWGVVGSPAGCPTTSGRRRPGWQHALDHAGLEQLTQLVDSGQLRPFVQQSFGLSEVGAAFNVSMGGQVVGKLSIDNTR